MAFLFICQVDFGLGYNFNGSLKVDMGYYSHVGLRDIYATALFHFVYHIRHATIAEKLNASFTHARGSLYDSMGAEVLGDNVLVNRDDSAKAIYKVMGALEGGMKVCRLLMQHTEGC